MPKSPSRTTSKHTAFHTFHVPIPISQIIFCNQLHRYKFTKADIRNPLRYLLINLLPLRGISVGALTPTKNKHVHTPALKSGGLP